MPNHPIEEYEAGYAEEAQQRYQRLESDIEDRIDDTDGEIGTAGFATAVASYVATRARTHGLQPSSGAPDSRAEYAWFDEYVHDSYADGREFARDMLRRENYTPSQGTVTTNPYHQQGLRKAQERQRKYWGSLTTDLRSEIREQLTTDLEQGATLQQARATALDRVEKTGIDRATRIANYEPNWAFSKATLSEYRAADVSNVRVDMRWETAGDAGVCPECAANEGVYTLTAADGMLENNEFPPHPFCRCLLVPE